jgi:protein dithiol:quinone oxidoreductase
MIDSNPARSTGAMPEPGRRARRGHPSDRWQLALLSILSLGAVGAALVSQHRFDMQPCPWCIVQRMLFVLIALVGLMGAVWPRPTARRPHMVATLIVVLFSVLGAASALWQQVFAAKSSSCIRTVADILVSLTQLDAWWPDVFQPRASCAEASQNLLGLPYATWSLILFLALAMAGVKMHLHQRNRVVFDDSNFGQ